MVTCSVADCERQAIVKIEIRGDDRVWYGCSSEHARLLISDIKEMIHPDRGIKTRGVIKIG